MRWKFLLRPGWLALIGFVLLFSAACLWILAPWQFRQDERRETQNSAITGSLETEAIDYDTALPPGANPAEKQWQVVKLTGRYLPEAETLVRLRKAEGKAAFEVLTPLRTDSGQIVIVNRGYIKVQQGTKPVAYDAAPGGQVTVIGRVRGSEIDPGRQDVLDQDGKRQIYTIDPTVLGKAVGLDLRPGYVQLNEEQPGVLGLLPLPKLEAGPFFSYALQWIAFGLMAPIGLVFLLWREAHPEEDDEDEPDEDDEEDSDPVPTPAPQTADRYGGRR
ncbi:MULTISPECIES: SURF1 family cytochrome oxidase biogenesis protein [unclassified Crossiella]|uniref:SURF1 family cytochrome oxidase biogenesis protein n=1 Tax=unclassified Crossiella TaxID=2620835 RepID=UPI0020004BCA|nr:MULTISPECIES: SURF1 family cytochrome oxidase biogenesis protein [unclassified Crossiella]MCK2240777.1 SURF1 family protein [Crossiella sp. S99.2]MCK2254079.1 SURF1 family protein [Crossiella sp. S99.1]